MVRRRKPSSEFARDDGGPKKLAPIWSRDRQRGDHNGPGPISAGFGNEAVEYRWVRIGKEDLAVM
jgi:hypothetical protein